MPETAAGPGARSGRRAGARPLAGGRSDPGTGPLDGTAHDDGDSPELLRRLAEATRRAEIIAAVNATRSETELGAVVSHSLCGALAADAAFLVLNRAGAPPALGGAAGLDEDQSRNVLRAELSRRSGSQFDPKLVETVLEVFDDRAAAPE